MVYQVAFKGKIYFLKYWQLGTAQYLGFSKLCLVRAHFLKDDHFFTMTTCSKRSKKAMWDPFGPFTKTLFYL